MNEYQLAKRTIDELRGQLRMLGTEICRHAFNGVAPETCSVLNTYYARSYATELRSRIQDRRWNLRRRESPNPNKYVYKLREKRIQAFKELYPTAHVRRGDNYYCVARSDKCKNYVEFPMDFKLISIVSEWGTFQGVFYRVVKQLVNDEFGRVYKIEMLCSERVELRKVLVRQSISTTWQLVDSVEDGQARNQRDFCNQFAIMAGLED